MFNQSWDRRDYRIGNIYLDMVFCFDKTVAEYLAFVIVCFSCIQIIKRRNRKRNDKDIYSPVSKLPGKVVASNPVWSAVILACNYQGFQCS